MRNDGISLDESALLHNLTTIRSFAPTQRVMAVLPRTAEPGLQISVANCLGNQVDAVAVHSMEMAISLRAMMTTPIVLLSGVFSPEDLYDAATHDIAVVLHHPKQVEWLLAAWLPARLSIWLEIRSAQNLSGFDESELASVIATLKSAMQVGQLRLIARLALADSPEDDLLALLPMEEVANAFQLEASLMTDTMLRGGSHNSGQWLRAGQALFGGITLPNSRPVLSTILPLWATRWVDEGDVLGECGEFQVHKHLRLGFVSLASVASSLGSLQDAIIHGRAINILPITSPDWLVLDLSGEPDVQEGDEVLLVVVIA